MGFGANLLGEFRAGRTLAQEVRSGFGGQPTVAEQTAQSGLARSLLQERIGQGQLSQQEAEFARFTEDSNLRSVFSGAIQASRFTDEASQNQFLEARIAEGQRQGRDMRDTLELRQTPFELRAPILRDTIELGFQAGLGRRPPGKATPAALQRFPGVDPEGREAFFTLDPRTRDLRRLEGVTPIPRATTEQSQTVTLPDGTTVELRTGPAGVARGTQTKLETSILEGTEQVARLDNIIEQLEANPTALDFVSRIESTLTDVQLQARGFLGGVSPERLERRVLRDEVVLPIRNEMLLFRRAITGAAGAAAEMKEIARAGINEEIPFPILINRAKQLRDIIKRTNFYKQKVLEEGLTGSFLDEDSGVVKRHNELWVLDRKARRLADKRFRELTRRNPDAPASAIIAQMIAETLLDENGEVPTVE